MSLDAASKKSNNSGSSSTLLPILALLCAQLFTASWHVLGKHVMSQVPYLAPISYVLIRTLITSLTLLLVGTIHEGHTPFPPMFRDGSSTATFSRELSLQAGLLKPSSSSLSIESGSSNVGLPLSQCNSTDSLNGKDRNNAQDPLISSSRKQRHHHRHHHRPRRKKRKSPTFKNYVAMALSSIIMTLRNIQYTFKYYQQQINNLNPETVQIIFAGLAGMLLLPICYTTGLILTSPTVASVWDGPMIPLGCFCAAVTLGLEKRSKSYPVGQVGSLLLTVGGSIIVLLVDYLGGGHGIKGVNDGDGATTQDDIKISNAGVNEHMQFIRGNMVLMGLVVAYSATALLQKRLNRYPPIQLTAWMFGIGFIGCLTVLILDSIFGSRISGCTLGEALIQLYAALTTSPTFRYGLLYSAFFVGGASFSIVSYASSHLESSVITLFAAMQPPITAVLEWIWEGKELGWKKIGGMCCVGLGMWGFTYIKRVEKERMGEHIHHQRQQRPQKYVHPTKAQSFENDNVQSSSVNGNGRNGSPNLTNRKPHADV
ncbi:hypothetical protein ACHAXR_013543 [Thalassiosira sp. AJA248-18]